MPWVKGQSGNPKGRKPKAQTLTGLMEKYLRQPAPGQGARKPGQRIVRNKDLFVRSVVDMAIAGDFNAARLVMNYVDGVPRAEIDVTHSGALVVSHEVELDGGLIESRTKALHAGSNGDS